MEPNHSELAVALFDKRAQDYQDKFMALDLYHDTFDRFCAHIPTPNARILELACGPGNITQYLLARRPDFQILGTDLAPKMLELARINNPSAVFELLDCRDIGSLHQTFDGIVLGFGLPYLTKEESIAFIRDAATLLNPDGVLYLSTMEDDYSKSGYKLSSKGEPLFLHYHQVDYLCEALEANGLVVLHLLRQNYPEQDGSTTIDLILIVHKRDNL